MKGIVVGVLTGVSKVKIDFEFSVFESSVFISNSIGFEFSDGLLNVNWGVC